MTATDLATTDQPGPLVVDKPKRLRIGRKLRQVLDLMVFEGDDMAEAARKANTSTRAIRKALERRHVLAYLRARREVLRASICAGNPRRLGAIRDQNKNLSAAVRAVTALERQELAEAAASRAAVAPGIVIVIGDTSSHMPHMREIEAKPLINNASGSDEGGER